MTNEEQIARDEVEIIERFDVVREEGWLYFVDVACDIYRIRMQEGRRKKGEPKPVPELVVTTLLDEREPGWLYFVTADGDLARVPDPNRKQKPRVAADKVKARAREPPATEPPATELPATKHPKERDALFAPEPGEYRCLSLRQPWADLVVRGIKKIEYRTWTTKYRGPILIHASAKLEASEMVALHYGPEHEWEQGGFVGLVDLIDVVADKENIGQYHWLVENPRRLEFRKARGKLSLYRVQWPPVGAVAASRKADRQSPETRVPAMVAFDGLLFDDEVVKLAQVAEADSGSASSARSSLQERYRFKFFLLLDQVDDALLAKLVERAGGEKSKRKSKSGDKNFMTLKHRLRVVMADDCRDELSDVTDEAIKVEGLRVEREAGFVYGFNGPHLLRQAEGVDKAELIAEDFLKDFDAGNAYDIDEETGEVWTAQFLTWGELAGE